MNEWLSDKEIEEINRRISVNDNGEDMQKDEGELERQNEGKRIQADEVLLGNEEGRAQNNHITSTRR